jgi:hypothetical protein
MNGQDKRHMIYDSGDTILVVRYEIYYCILLVLPMAYLPKVTPEQILQMINEKGARHVVAQLYANDSDESEWWNHVILRLAKETRNG